jgi:hypothetical protein
MPLSHADLRELQPLGDADGCPAARLLEGFEASRGAPVGFVPQQYASPFVVRAQVRVKLVLMLANRRPPTTRTTPETNSVEPFPSSPLEFVPQQKASPSRVIPQPCDGETSTAVSRRPIASTGRRGFSVIVHALRNSASATPMERWRARLHILAVEIGSPCRRARSPRGKTREALTKDRSARYVPASSRLPLGKDSFSGAT